MHRVAKHWLAAVVCAVLANGPATTRPAAAQGAELWLKGLKTVQILLFPPGEAAKACGLEFGPALLPQSVMAPIAQAGLQMPVPTGGTTAISYFLTVRDEAKPAPGGCYARISFGLELSTSVAVGYSDHRAPVMVPLFVYTGMIAVRSEEFLQARTRLLEQMGQAFAEAWKRQNAP